MGDGESPELFFMGAHTLTLAVFVANFKLFLWQWQQSWYVVAITMVEMLFWWFTCAISSVLEEGSAVETFVLGWAGLWNHVQGRFAFWALMLLVPSLALFPQYIVGAWSRCFYPEFRDLAMEVEKRKLDLGPLERWQIPIRLRISRLVKRAPLRQKVSATRRP